MFAEPIDLVIDQSTDKTPAVGAADVLGLHFDTLEGYIKNSKEEVADAFLVHIARFERFYSNDCLYSLLLTDSK